MKFLTAERLHHLFLDQTVEDTDIRHHTGHWINGAMDRHKAVPFGTLPAILQPRERVTARDAGDVEPGRRHISIQIFILIQPNRVERADGFLPIQLGPEDACKVFRRGNPAFEVGHIQVQILMVKFFEHIEQDALQLLKNPGDQTKMQEIVTLADDAYHGVDVNGDGQIDPVAGEAGALTAYLQGQLMATLSLVPNA